MADKKIKIGDVVTLKSGGIDMTVTGRDDNNIDVSYFAESQGMGISLLASMGCGPSLQCKSFPQECLIKEED